MTWLETLAHVLEIIAPVAAFVGLLTWGMVQFLGLFFVIFLYTKEARDPEPPAMLLRISAPLIWAAGCLAFATTIMFALEFPGRAR